jgi:mRNA-degrading endonuclease HigB of HigAB toxin-antitoxin module
MSRYRFTKREHLTEIIPLGDAQMLTTGEYVLNVHGLSVKVVIEVTPTPNCYLVKPDIMNGDWDAEEQMKGSDPCTL